MFSTFPLRNTARTVGLVLLLAVAGAVAAPEQGIVRAKVTAILDKLPDEFKPRMADFAGKVEKYINAKDWIEEDYVMPFTIGLQFFLEYRPTSTEDRYQCSLMISGPDLQYFDKRAIFPFQQNETITDSPGYVPVRALIDFYVYLLIGNELDKYGALAGTQYFEKARAILQEAKFSQFVYGWDYREDTLLTIFGENYKKFRELKDYYFYGMSALQEEPGPAREYIKQSLERLEIVLRENKDNQAARQFIDAHYSEIIDVFKGRKDIQPFQILLRLDPERKQIYEKQIAAEAN
ncbi:MAG: DUF4835 family protein [candidate division KSB1 bacterium]|nr:DUF4835 family protein [candidate division KSB1 bacterium]MDZ7272695.1 DUF4835 family protein [candidate division KSB1 bacterium]MDZ7284282.1 DUF4835 family protein [candidate division KSB1 bacterium]MDZ7297322.1 DUF4835 family protein [candidate division KSB1 bacterium]MDZ7308390.1 DUF4835 family protein [candidate division KSB1 bacterium]